MAKVIIATGDAAQGFGPARNIIAFTGGDLACQPEFYVKSTEKIKNLGEGLWMSD